MPVWRLRLTRELPRYALIATALAGLLASARFAIAPPQSHIARIAPPLSLLPDRAAEGLAMLFARLYLTWDARDPEAHQRALAPLLGSWMEADAGFQVPPSGSQQVQWAQIVQSRIGQPGEHVYTIAAQTDTSGLLYLTVEVRRGADSSLGIVSYPAFVGAPAYGPAPPLAHGREVEDRALASVVTRALRNYLADAPSELAADLTANARVSLPGVGLALQAVRSLELTPDGRSVVAVVQVQDARAAQYTLAYELDVVSDAGRWEVAAIQMDPDE
jgi:conjugative transposon protein TcpC